MNIEELYTKLPELEEIALRLEDSEKDAKTKLAERKRGNRTPKTESASLFPDDQKNRRSTYNVYAEHAKIDCFYKDGRWNTTAFLLKPGRIEFENSLTRIVSTRNPEAIRIKIYPTNKEVNVRFDKTIWLDPSKVNIDAEKQIQSSEIGLTNKKFDEALAQLAEQQKQMNSANPIQDSNAQFQLIQLQNAMQIAEFKHAHELDNIKRDYEDQLKELRRDIEEKEEQIEELEAELADTDEELNGIEEKIEAAKTPDWISLAGKVIANAGENLIKNNVDFIGDSLGIPKDELKKYFESKDKKELSQAEKSEASFEQVSDDPFEDLDEAQKKYAMYFVQMVKAMSKEDMQKIITILDAALLDSKTEGLQINEVVVDEMLRIALNYKQQ